MSEQFTITLNNDVAKNLEKRLENNGVPIGRSSYVNAAIKEKLEKEQKSDDKFLRHLQHIEKTGEFVSLEKAAKKLEISK